MDSSLIFWSFGSIFMLILCLDGVISSGELCGTVFTTEGNILELKEDVALSGEEFALIHQKKLKGAIFNPEESRKCKIQVCGFTSFDRRYNDDYIGSPRDYSDCRSFMYNNSKAPPEIFNDDYNASSISCACKKNVEGCSYSCEEKRAHLNITWEENGCAKLYVDEECNDCFYQPHVLKTTHEYSTNYSIHINSIFVRSNCVVSQNIPALKKYWRFKNSRLPINYTVSNDTRGVMSAFDTTPETFTCKCGVEANPPPTTTPVALTPKKEEDNVPITTIALSIVTGLSLLALGLLIGCKFRNSREDGPPSIFLLWLPKYFRGGSSKRGSGDSALTVSTVASNTSGPLDYCRLMDIPFNEAYDTSEILFETQEKLGEGNYGQVYKARLDIAVKIVKVDVNSSAESFRALQQEIKILTRIGPHANVVRLIGINADNMSNGKLYMLVEYCENGSLLSYLKTVVEPHIKSILMRRASDSVTFSGQYPRTNELETFQEKIFDLETLDPRMLKQMYYWAEKIANGMDHISSMKVIHGDLAARNILLTHKLVPKIADFSLSRKTYVNLNFNESPNECPPGLPLRWLAPEVLLNSKESFLEPKSDVWSYAVCVWEIFTLAEYAPYNDKIYQRDVEKAISNYEKPGIVIGCVTPKIFQKLSECWVKNPTNRPSFKSLCEHFCEEYNRVQLPPETLSIDVPDQSLTTSFTE